MKKIMIVWLVLWQTTGAVGGGYSNSTIQQNVLFTGSSVTNIRRDESALFANPGSVILNEKSGIQGGLGITSPSFSFLDDANVVNHSENVMLIPFSVSSVIKLKGRWSAGMVVNTPFLYNAKWGNLWSGRFMSISSELSAIYIQPTLCYKINEHWGIGAGVIAGNIFFKNEKALPYENAQNGLETHLSIKGSGTGFGFNSGIFGTYGRLDIGLAYRSSVTADVRSGKATLSNAPQSLIKDGTLSSISKSEGKLALPGSLTAGINIRIGEKIRLGLDYIYTGWSVANNKEITVPGYGVYGINSSSAYMAGSALTLSAWYHMTGKISLMASAGIDQKAVNANYISPAMPDGSRMITSFSLTRRINDSFSLNLGIIYEVLAEQRQDAEGAPMLAGTYKGVILNGGAGIRYEF